MPSGCEDKGRLIAYLYDEDAPAERAAFEAHLASCAACADEVRALGAVRRELAGWEAPDVELGFRVVREQPRVNRWNAVPAWAQAAAAVLLLAGGAALANLDIRYDAQGLSVRTGWQHATPASAAAPVTATVMPARAPRNDQAWQTAVREIEARVRADLASEVRTQLASAQLTMPAHAQPAPARTSADVDALIAASEKRQERLLALRLAELAQDVDAQRRTDLVRIEQNLGQIEGTTGADLAQQREMVRYLMRTSLQR